MEVEEFLSGIQEQIDASASSVAGHVSAVQFFPPEYPGTFRATVPDVPTEENFREHDELQATSRILAHLQELGSEMQLALEQIDEVPANPGTVRGAVGRWVILILRRLLWWHTRPVSAFADAVTRDLKEQVALLEQLSKTQTENRRTLLSIQQALTTMGARLEKTDEQDRQPASRTSQLESDVRATAELKASLAPESRGLSTSAGSLEAKPNCAELRKSEAGPGVRGRRRRSGGTRISSRPSGQIDRRGSRVPRLFVRSAT